MANQMGSQDLRPDEIDFHLACDVYTKICRAKTNSLDQKLTARWVLADNADQTTPYVADQTLRPKLSHALIFF